MSTGANLALRAYLITWLKADAALAAIVGTRVWEVAPHESDAAFAYPFLLVRPSMINDDTHSERGARHDVKIYVEGDKSGTKQGDEIFALVRDRIHAIALPAALTGNQLATIIWQDEDIAIAEDGKRYAGLQRWTATTEATA